MVHTYFEKHYILEVIIGKYLEPTQILFGARAPVRLAAHALPLLRKKGAGAGVGAAGRRQVERPVARSPWAGALDEAAEEEEEAVTVRICPWLGLELSSGHRFWPVSRGRRWWWIGRQ